MMLNVVSLADLEAMLSHLTTREPLIDFLEI
jgi:hypothetical protein